MFFFFLKNGNPPTFLRSPQRLRPFLILSKTNLVWTKNSMSIAFLQMVVDESDGLVKSDNCFVVRLSDASLLLPSQHRRRLLSLSQVHACLEHLRQASSCFRTVAARTTRQCESYPHSSSGPNVCKCLRSIQQLVKLLLKIAGGSSFFHSLKFP